MCWYIRGIRAHTKWGNTPPWLNNGTAPAELLFDFRPFDNALSFWKIESNGSNRRRVLAALAAAKDHIQPFNFLVCDASCFGEISCVVKQSEGESPDAEANANWHYDVCQLTAGGVGEFITMAFNDVNRHKRLVGLAGVGRIYKKNIKSLIEDSIQKKYLSTDKLSEDIKKHF